MKYFVKKSDARCATLVEYRKGKWEGDWASRDDSIYIEKDILAESMDFLNALRVIFPDYTVWDAYFDMKKEDWIALGKNIPAESRGAMEIYAEASEWAEKAFQESEYITIVGF